MIKAITGQQMTGRTQTVSGAKAQDGESAATGHEDNFQATPGNDLASFLQRATYPNTVVPTEHYATVRSHHEPDIQGGATLTPQVLGEALEAWTAQNPGRKLDLIGLEACQMGPTLESLGDLHGKYLIAGAADTAPKT